jgi:hypothetical protein
LILILICISSVSAVDYFTDRMNFPTNESKLHNQTLTNDGSSSITINATIPAAFNLSSTDCSQINSSLVSCTIPASSSRYYAIDSPSNCTEGTIYKSKLTGNITEEFTFVCIPDNKITDCKIEYGHGDANYLPDDQLFISTEPATIFNLVRVWNIGHYLIPDEDAKNATIKCQYEMHPVRTYGRVEMDYATNEINGTFLWIIIEGGYWFRIGVVSQDVSGKSIGDFYNKSCTNLTYQFNHHQVVADSTNCNLEIRNIEPFTFSVTAHPYFTNKSVVTITNNEKYDVYDISFDKLLNGVKHTETYRTLESGEYVRYIVDNSTQCNTSIFFIPSWYINSWHPKYYTQTLNCTPTVPNTPPHLIGNIPDQTWQMNTNNTNAFDLDNYFGDNDADPLNYSFTNVSNITVIINSTTNQVSFIPDINWTGTRNITFYTNDSINTTSSNIVQLNVYICGNNVVETGEQCDGTNLSSQTCTGLGYSGGTLSCTASCTFNTSACTSPSPPSGGGGGGGGGGFIPPTAEEKAEEKDIELTIISYPRDITLYDKEFVVFAEVKNTGKLPLENVVLEADPNGGWDAETTHLGDLAVGEKKITQIKIENNICSEGSFLIDPEFKILLTAKEQDVSDSEDIMINMEVNELTVLTDEQEYAEGDVMRLCIIYNNLNQEMKDKIEFEVNFLYEKEAYIIDYLSSFSVNQDKILIVTRDYVLDDIPITADYNINVKMYGQGVLFSGIYLIAEETAKVTLNGIIEDQILQRENTVYDFKYDNEQHSVHINKIDDDFVEVTVYSSPKNFTIKILETIYVDLDDDNTSDISLTYVGLEDSKADIRLKILSKRPKQLVETTASYEVGIGEITPELEKPGVIPGELSFGKKLKTFVVLGLFRLAGVALSIFIFLVILNIVFYFSPESHKYFIKAKNKVKNILKNNKFLNIKIKKIKKRGE